MTHEDDTRTTYHEGFDAKWPLIGEVVTRNVKVGVIRYSVTRGPVTIDVTKSCYVTGANCDLDGSILHGVSIEKKLLKNVFIITFLRGFFL